MSKLPFTIGRDIAFGREVETRRPELHDLLTGPPGTTGRRVDWLRVCAWLVFPPALWAAIILTIYFFTH